jgi:hypothetical protein
MAENVARGVKTAMGDAVAWAEAKAEMLSAKEEDGTGPYGSMATCAPSDFDAIATGVLRAVSSSEKTQDNYHSGPEKEHGKEVPDGPEHIKIE